MWQVANGKWQMAKGKGNSRRDSAGTGEEDKKDVPTQ
jgi:hypothetical protein